MTNLYSSSVVMFSRLFLLVVLSTRCSGEYLDSLPPRFVVLAGDVAILPCNFSNGDDFQSVEWSKKGLKPDVVLLYREGREEHGMKNSAFRHRTSLVSPELSDHNFSLRIADVQLSDEGNYTCKSISNSREITTVWLLVAAVSEPELTLVGENGVTLQCEVNSSQFGLQMEFLDGEGNIITADEPKRHQEDSGFFTVTRRVTVPDSITRVTCKVHQREINQTWIKTLSIPAYCRSSSPLFYIIIIGVLCLLLVVILIYVAWTHCRSGADQHSSLRRQQTGDSTVSVHSEKLPLVHSPQSDMVMSHRDSSSARSQTGNGTKRHQQDNPPQLSPTSSKPPLEGRFPQDLGPKPAGGAPVQKGFHPNVVEPSSPPADNMFKKDMGKIRRTMSDSSAWPRPIISKPRYQYSMLNLQGSLSGNRFAVLAEDESELQ